MRRRHPSKGADVSAITNLFKRHAEPDADIRPLSAPSTLEELIDQLTPWGKVRVGQYGHQGTNWHCSIEVHVAPVGARFEVRSDFDHPTPALAAKVCVERLRVAIASLGGKA